MTMSLSPTARGLRLIRSTHSAPITLPPDAGGSTQTLLVTETNDPIVTETGVSISTETA
jgi:hypothetical protein